MCCNDQARQKFIDPISMYFCPVSISCWDITVKLYNILHAVTAIRNVFLLLHVIISTYTVQISGKVNVTRVNHKWNV